ncbi:hypothetical protein HAX54_018517 [Datura stramonium]|uniref:Uncharacterized protein n=1 Tax=Datura stramonium TaxID=4076 RepID=A0ABS8UPM8_DATST|nr:hypothetical protein [Datura stramonium]
MGELTRLGEDRLHKPTYGSWYHSTNHRMVSWDCLVNPNTSLRVLCFTTSRGMSPLVVFEEGESTHQSDSSDDLNGDEDSDEGTDKGSEEEFYCNYLIKLENQAPKRKKEKDQPHLDVMMVRGRAVDISERTISQLLYGTGDDRNPIVRIRGQAAVMGARVVEKAAGRGEHVDAPAHVELSRDVPAF